MRENRIEHYRQMELDDCRNKLVWLIRCHDCAVDNYPAEEYPPRLLPIPPDYIDNLQGKMSKAMKGILPLTLEMIIKTYYPLPARQAPVHPQQQRIPSCSPSPMPCTKLGWLRDD